MKKTVVLPVPDSVVVRKIRDGVLAYFKGDVDKAQLWFMLPNPSLGEISPNDMLRAGRERRLLQFVEESAMAETAAALRTKRN